MKYNRLKIWMDKYAGMLNTYSHTSMITEKELEEYQNMVMKNIIKEAKSGTYDENYNIPSFDFSYVNRFCVKTTTHMCGTDCVTHKD